MPKRVMTDQFTPKPGEPVWFVPEERVVEIVRICPDSNVGGDAATCRTKSGTKWTCEMSAYRPLTEAPKPMVDEWFTGSILGKQLRAYREDGYVVITDCQHGSLVIRDEDDSPLHVMLKFALNESNIIPMSAELADELYGEGNRPYPKRGE